MLQAEFSNPVPATRHITRNNSAGQFNAARGRDHRKRRTLFQRRLRVIALRTCSSAAATDADCNSYQQQQTGRAARREVTPVQLDHVFHVHSVLAK